MSKPEFNYCGHDQVECPYCEHTRVLIYDDYEGSKDGLEFDEECSKCGKKFLVAGYFDPSWSVSVAKNEEPSNVEAEKCVTYPIQNF